MSLFKIILNSIPRPILNKGELFGTPNTQFIIWLKGTRYTDPIDGKSFRKLLPYGYGKQRKNALSPSYTYLWKDID